MRSDSVLGAEHPEMSGEEPLTLGSSQNSGGHKQRGNICSIVVQGGKGMVWSAGEISLTRDAAGRLL